MTSRFVPLHFSRMARRRWIEFPGAIYYVMNPDASGWCEPIFLDHPDRQRFGETLVEVCATNRLATRFA